MWSDVGLLVHSLATRNRLKLQQPAALIIYWYLVLNLNDVVMVASGLWLPSIISGKQTCFGYNLTILRA